MGVHAIRLHRGLIRASKFHSLLVATLAYDLEYIVESIKAEYYGGLR